MQEGTLYLLRLVLRNVLQGAVCVQAHPHQAVREFGRSLIRLQLGGCSHDSNQSEMRKSHKNTLFHIFQKEIVILVKKTTSSTVCGPRRVITIKLADLDEMISLYS